MSGLYRNSTIGECLEEALNELMEKDKINGEVRSAGLFLIDYATFPAADCQWHVCHGGAPSKAAIDHKYRLILPCILQFQGAPLQHT